MTIREAKALKTELENKIRELLSEFQSKTELRVQDVELYAENIAGNYSVRVCVSL